ncbi:MAG: family 16 glycoside hydrolase [Pirellulales bacterium]
MKMNFWRGAVLALLFVAGSTAWSAAEDEPGFKPLFNGKDLTGWEGNPEFWSVRDEAITGQTTADKPTNGNTFLTWTLGPVDDFELRLQYKIVGGNSGIQYRSQSHGNWVVGGYQADFEAGDTYSGILYEERGRGILAQRGQRTTINSDGKVEETGKVGDTTELQANIKKEDWNDYTIVASGNHLTHIINGKTTVDVTDDQVERRAMSGILALQLHAGPPMTVQFRNIRLKRTPLADRKKIVLVAGTPSHAAGDHEFNAGSALVKQCLDKLPQVQTALYTNGWPKDPTAFDNADAVMLYMDGGGGHPLIQADRLKEFEDLMARGVGLACYHYAVEVPKDRGGPELLAWIGGYYETGYSINPHWTADFKALSKHPITNGVKPFAINDEWYYNIRLRPGAIEPILRATPPDDTRRTPAAAEFKGREEIVAWACERPDGGRGFGFTGGHVHKNWGNEDFRKLALNSLLWVAKVEVPEDGVASDVSEEDLGKNLDPK